MTDDIEWIEPGPRSSQAVIYGGFVHLAGQVARGREGADAATQTEAILARLDALLAAAGTDKSRLVSATVYLSDIRHFNAMNEVWMGWVVPGRTPARAVVEARLVTPGYDVEIAVVAAGPREQR